MLGRLTKPPDKRSAKNCPIWRWQKKIMYKERWWCMRPGGWLRTQSRVYLLIGVLEWKNSHSTLIEISLPIILYLYFTWPEFLPISILWERSFAHLLGICIFCSRDLYLRHSIRSRWASLESHVTKSWGDVTLRDQVWYGRSLFYI